MRPLRWYTDPARDALWPAEETSWFSTRAIVPAEFLAELERWFDTELESFEGGPRASEIIGRRLHAELLRWVNACEVSPTVEALVRPNPIE